ncbi:MAG: CehA/McbA family metallohydrolase [Anaerolineae bacterium]|nr:CehA/McbA family metallohydrolase [Anaerolineae bacterium]
MAPLHELVGNVHMHTPYSDGEASHADIAHAARAAGLDFVIVTDHNVLVKGVEGYYGDDESGHVLLLTGEEVHDRTRLPQCNHMLIFGASRELTACANDPQQLIDAAEKAGGLSFLAHPHDQPLTAFKEPAIPWLDLHVQRFTGLEIWNYMSAFKGILNRSTRVQQVRAAFRPEDFMVGPPPETLALWDDLLGKGRRVVGIGGSDAHGTTFRVGPLEHVVFPYDYLFSGVNLHVLAPQPLSGDAQTDAAMIYRALRAGNAFIGYDLLGSTRGFRFSATGQSNSTIMGGSIRLGPGVTLQALAYERSHFKLVRHGQVVAEATGRENLTHTATRSGAYRVEVWREYRGQERAWILSNPIYVEDSAYTAR